VLFRVGVLAGLRSKKLDGKTIGVMVTASHNPEQVPLIVLCCFHFSTFDQDNGVKLVDPRGEMLDTSWEIHATTLSNAQTTDEFISELEKFVQNLKIDLSKPAHVVYARDTRPSGDALVSSLEDGIKAIGAEGRNAGVTTTPILHYLVRTINTKGTKESYGEDSEEGYFLKLTNAYKKLVVCIIHHLYGLTLRLFLVDASDPPAFASRLREWRRCAYCREIGRVPRRYITFGSRKRVNHDAWSPEQRLRSRLCQNHTEITSIVGGSSTTWPTRVQSRW
jgi:hypothetical protein